MPEPVALLSSVRLKPEELITFLRTANIPGRVIIKGSNDPYLAHLVKGKENVWIAIDNSGLDYYEEGEEDTKLIRQKLGTCPQTYIIIDISGTEPKTQRLAVAFAAAFAEQWPCVVNNLEGEDQKIYSVQEIFELQKEGKGFWDQK